MIPYMPTYYGHIGGLHYVLRSLNEDLLVYYDRDIVPYLSENIKYYEYSAFNNILLFSEKYADGRAPIEVTLAFKWHDVTKQWLKFEPRGLTLV